MFEEKNGMIMIHCMLKKEYDVIKNNEYYGEQWIKQDGFLHFSTWNSFYDIANSFISENEEWVILCVDTDYVEATIMWEDMDGLGVYYPHLYGPLNMNSIVDVVAFHYEDGKWLGKPCIHVLMNTSSIDEDWCFPTLSKYIHKSDKVCVVALSFWEDIKNVNDWNSEYGKPNGRWYHANVDVWKRYGIDEENIEWIHYFEDDRKTAYNKILNSSIVFFTGGAPDQMMKRIKELQLEEVLERYQGVMIGYSAGAMIQIENYHITPDIDYANFSYESGLRCIQEFDIEVHYEETELQNTYIQKVMQEKGSDVYAIYDDGGIIVTDTEVKLFGRVNVFKNTLG